MAGMIQLSVCQKTPIYAIERWNSQNYGFIFFISFKNMFAMVIHFDALFIIRIAGENF